MDSKLIAPLTFPSSEEIRKYADENEMGIMHASRKLTRLTVLKYTEEATTFEELKRVLLWAVKTL